MTHGDLRLIEGDSPEHFLHLHVTSDGTSWPLLLEHVLHLPHLLVFLGRQWFVNDTLWRRANSRGVKKRNFIYQPCLDWWAYRHGQEDGWKVNPKLLRIKDTRFFYPAKPVPFDRLLTELSAMLPLGRGFGLHGIASLLTMAWPGHFMTIAPGSADEETLKYWGLKNGGPDMPTLTVEEDKRRYNMLTLSYREEDEETRPHIVKDLEALQAKTTMTCAETGEVLGYSWTLDKSTGTFHVTFALEAVYAILLHADMKRLARGGGLDYVQGIVAG